MESVESFYDELSSRYTELISKCVPRYGELMYNMFHYIPADLKPSRILDLGCGTGNLTEQILKYYPEAEIDTLDISEDILKESQKRFMAQPNVRHIQADFRHMHLPPGSYDLILSSIAIHHIPDPDKINLYRDIQQALKPNGLFIFADQTRGINEEIYKKHISRWKEEAFKLGSTQENWDMWMQHQDAHDFHTPVSWHLKTLEQAGFKEVDIIWKNIMWAVIWAQK
ncbi:class I SAM-dependent methyltransferase [Daejeonella oryzae]|uniref:class I SAM-dependent methyltransferase n=1 Tax=Daejeonella oryzae TaxID=1122943 RepID=UPI000427D470|nr:class I SAM-dependent methyltransferase [Daejeonella oryzae]